LTATVRIHEVTECNAIMFLVDRASISIYQTTRKL